MKPNYLNKEIYNKPTLVLALLTPIIRIEVAKTSITTIISVAANDECFIVNLTCPAPTECR